MRFRKDRCNCAAKRAAQRAAAAAQSAADDEGTVEQSDAVKQALHREQVAQPTETSADGTDSVNKTIRKGKKIGRKRSLSVRQR